MIKETLQEDFGNLFSQLDKEAKEKDSVHQNLNNIIMWIYTAIAKAITMDGIIDDEEREFIEETLKRFSLQHMDAFRKFSRDLHSPDLFLREFVEAELLSKELRQNIFKVILAVLVVEAEFAPEEEYVEEIGEKIGVDKAFIQSEVTRIQTILQSS